MCAAGGVPAEDVERREHRLVVPQPSCEEIFVDNQVCALRLVFDLDGVDELELAALTLAENSADDTRPLGLILHILRSDAMVLHVEDGERVHVHDDVRGRFGDHVSGVTGINLHFY